MTHTRGRTDQFSTEFERANLLVVTYSQFQISGLLAAHPFFLKAELLTVGGKEFAEFPNKAVFKSLNILAIVSGQSIRTNVINTNSLQNSLS